jgi:hypothetical protein
MSETSTDFFGGLKGMRDVPQDLEHRAVQISDEQGFTLRQPMREPPRRRRGTALQLHNFTMRLHMDDMDRFIKWCEAERIAYREGFQKLVAKLEQDRGSDQ